MLSTLFSFCKLMSWSCFALAIAATTARARQVPPGVPPSGQDDPVPAYSEETKIPRDTLVCMYRTELGNRFREEDVEKIIEAHQTLENYFDAPSRGPTQTGSGCSQPNGP